MVSGTVPARTNLSNIAIARLRAFRDSAVTHLPVPKIPVPKTKGAAHLPVPEILHGLFGGSDSSTKLNCSDAIQPRGVNLRGGK